MTPFVAELVGTMIMILMGGGVVANVCLNKTKGFGSGWIVIATAWALAVYIGVVVAGPFSGAHLNPAVTLGLALVGRFEWAYVIPYFVAQFIGAAIGAFLVWVVYKDHFDATEDQDSKLGVFCTIPAISNPIRNFLTEVIGTFALMFVVYYISDGKISLGGGITAATAVHSTLPVGLGSVGAIPVAFTVWVIGLSLGGPTGYAINPARDIAPRFVHFILPIKGKGGSHWNYSWIPCFGPLVGAAIAAGLYYVVGLITI